MDAQATTRLLVAEYRQLDVDPLQQQKARLTQVSGVTSVSAVSSKHIDKKRSWLGLSRKRSSKTIAQESEDSEPHMPEEKLLEEDGSSHAIRGMRNWLSVLSAQQGSHPNEYSLQITTVCRLLVDAAREQFDALCDLDKADGHHEENKQGARKSNVGLLKMLTMKSSAGAASADLDWEEDDLREDELDDALLALNALSDVIAVPSALNNLPPTFVESIINLCFDELGTSITNSIPSRRIAAIRCLSVVSACDAAHLYVSNSIVGKSLQSLKGPSLSKHVHHVHFSFATAARAACTLKVFSQVLSSLPRLEAFRLEASLLISAILQGANDFGGNAFESLLDKKQQDQFLTDTKSWCDTLLKWSKKRVEPVRAVSHSLIIAMSVWASLARDDKELAEVLELRKHMVVERLIPSIRNAEEIAGGLRLVSLMLKNEVKLELYRKNDQWRYQTLQKLLPNILKHGVGHDYTEILSLCAQIAPDEVFDDWLFTATTSNGAKSSIAFRAATMAVCKGGFHISPSALNGLKVKQLEPALFLEDLMIVMPSPEDSAPSGLNHKDTGELGATDEEIGAFSEEPAWLENTSSSANIGIRSGSHLASPGEQIAIQVLKMIPHVYSAPFPEKLINRVGELAAAHINRLVTSQAATTLRALAADAAVKGLVDALSTAEIDSPRTTEGLSLLTSLLTQSGVSSSNRSLAEGILVFHEHASLEKTRARLSVSAKHRLKIDSKSVSEDGIAQARALARARLRPLMRGWTKLKRSTHGKEVTGSLLVLFLTSRGDASSSAELTAVAHSLIQELPALPNWLINRLLWSIQVAFHRDCEFIMSEALGSKCLVTSGSELSILSTRTVLLMDASLQNHRGPVDDDPTHALLESFASKLLACVPSEIFSSQPEVYATACLRLLRFYIDATEDMGEDVTQKCVRALLGCGKLVPNLERQRFEAVGALVTRSSRVGEKTLATFTEQATIWWTQVSIGDDSEDLRRAERVLMGALLHSSDQVSQLTAYVERGLRDAGPAGILYSRAIVRWVDQLESAPASKAVLPLLLLASLTQRRGPTDALLKLISRAVRWFPHLSKDKHLLLSMLAAEDLRDHGDSSVALLASKACARMKWDTDEASVVEQAAKLASRLSSSETALRALTIVLEPWVGLAELESQKALLTSLFEFTELALSTSPNLRPFVLRLWSEASSAYPVHECILDLLWTKGNALALQVWRVCLERAEGDKAVDAVLGRVSGLPLSGVKTIPPVLVDIVLATIRHSDAIRSKLGSDGLSAVLGRIVHLGCVSSSPSALRMLLRFAREEPGKGDVQAMKEQVMSAVATDGPVMDAACSAAIDWVAAFESNPDLAIASAEFLVELHNSQPPGARRSRIPRGGAAKLVRCASEALRNHSDSLLRRLLRFGSVLDLDAAFETSTVSANLLASDEDLSVWSGLAGACLHAGPADVQLEASLVLRREWGEEQRREARRWFLAVTKECGADEDDGLVQFVATGERFDIDEVLKCIEAVANETSGVIIALRLIRAAGSSDSGEVEELKAENLGGCESDSFVDTLTAVACWENSTMRLRANKVLALNAHVLRSASSSVSCRCVRAIMNEFVSAAADSPLKKAAQSVLLSSVGLDDGIALAPVSLSMLFVIPVQSLTKTLDDLAASTALPPIPASRIFAPPTIPPSRIQETTPSISTSAKVDKRESPQSEEEQKSNGGGPHDEDDDKIEELLEVQLEPLMDEDSLGLDDTLEVAQEHFQRRNASLTETRPDEEKDRKRKYAHVLPPGAIEKQFSTAAHLADAALLSSHPLVLTGDRKAPQPVDTVGVSLSGSSDTGQTNVLSPREADLEGTRRRGSIEQTPMRRKSSLTNIFAAVLPRRGSLEKLYDAVPVKTSELLSPRNADAEVNARHKLASPEPKSEVSAKNIALDRAVSPDPHKGHVPPLTLLSPKGAAPPTILSPKESTPPAMERALSPGPRKIFVERARSPDARKPPTERAMSPEPKKTTSVLSPQAKPSANGSGQRAFFPEPVAPINSGTDQASNLPRRNSAERLVDKIATSMAKRPPSAEESEATTTVHQHQPQPKLPTGKPAPPHRPTPPPASARRALPGMTGEPETKSRALPGTTGKVALPGLTETGAAGNQADETSMEHHSMQRPIIPAGRRRRPTVTSQASGDSML